MDEVVKKTAEKLGLPEDVVETIIRHKYQWLRRQLKNPTSVLILDNKFATYKMMERALNKLLEGNLKEEIRDRFEKYKPEIEKFNNLQKEIGKKRENGKKKNNEG